MLRVLFSIVRNVISVKDDVKGEFKEAIRAAGREAACLDGSHLSMHSAHGINITYIWMHSALWIKLR